MRKLPKIFLRTFENVGPDEEREGVGTRDGCPSILGGVVPALRKKLMLVSALVLLNVPWPVVSRLYGEQCQQSDTDVVEVELCQGPLSRTRHWRLLTVVDVFTSDNNISHQSH